MVGGAKGQDLRIGCQAAVKERMVEGFLRFPAGKAGLLSAEQAVAVFGQNAQRAAVGAAIQIAANQNVVMVLQSGADKTQLAVLVEFAEA